MSAHTPGPWQTRFIKAEQCIVADVGTGSVVLARQVKGADARLIAAAPTMFDYVSARAVAGDSEAQRILEAINGHA
jgi:hypothetical protein